MPATVYPIFVKFQWVVIVGVVSLYFLDLEPYLAAQGIYKKKR